MDNLLEPVMYQLREGHIDEPLIKLKIRFRVVGHIGYPPWKRLIGIPFNIVKMIECDYCQKLVPYHQTKHIMRPLQSEPDTLGCILRGCEKCFPDGMTIKEIVDYFDDGRAEKDGYYYHLLI